MSSNATFSDIKDFLASIRKLGADVGKGALARPEFIVDLATAAQEGTVNEDNAEEIWDTFDNAAAKKLDGIATQSKNETARNVRISEVRTIILVANFEFLQERTLADILTDSRATILDCKLNAGYTGNTQDAFLRVVRAQKAKKKAGEDDPLSDDEVRAAILGGKAPADASEKKQLDAIKKSLERLIKGTKGKEGQAAPKPAYPSEEAADALTLIEARLAHVTLVSEPGYNSLNDAGY